MSPAEKALHDMTRSVEKHVFWQRGVYSAWECTALVDADMLSLLVTLAAQAPTAERKEFLATFPVDAP